MDTIVLGGSMIDPPDNIVVVPRLPLVMVGWWSLGQNQLKTPGTMDKLLLFWSKLCTF